MVLKIDHFNTLTRQNLNTDEKIKNSLAEYLLPDTTFSIGAVYQNITTPEHLENYENKSLQFASGERMYFADKEVRSLVYPNQSDGAAYGSLIFTPCQSLEEIDARILVIDDETGASGGMMPPDEAKQLVGDCYGKIGLEVAQKLTGLTNTPFQYRLGIKPQGENSVYRIAKGTLAPAKLDDLSGVKIITKRTQNGRTFKKIGYELILPTSSFKGRKIGYEPIEPGEYNLKVGIGIKTLAKYGEQSLGTQVLVNYPQAVKTEILALVKAEAEKLADNQSSPQKLAQEYIKLYERRKELTQSGDKNQNYEELEGFDRIIDEAFGDNETKIFEEDHNLYKLLKADKHGKLTEHPKIIDELNKFVRKRWVDLATGRSVKFQAGMAQPSLKLKEDEICIPHVPEGKEVIVTRSPLINSNGVIVLKNRHLPEVNHLKGVVHINPVTAAKHLQADFDGDRLAFEMAEKFPILAEEVKEYNLEANRYPDIVKRDKIPYQGTFAEIALSAADNQIGAIANQIQRAVALRWEAQELPESEKLGYVKNIAKKMSGLIEESQPLPNKYCARIKLLANLPERLSAEESNRALKTVESINFDLVADLGNQLQVAVDGPKSAARPDEELLKTLKAIGSYKYPQWLLDKKNPEAYQNRQMQTNGYSPIDLIVAETNKHFQQNQLMPEPTVSFRPLFSDIKFNRQKEELARSVRDTYNSLIAEAIATERKVDQPILKVTSATSSRTIEIDNLLKFAKSDSPIWKAKKLNIGIKSNPKNKNELLAVAIDPTDNHNQEIGTISAEQVKQFGLKPGHTLKGATIRIEPGATKTQSEAMFQRVTNYLDKIRQNTPELVQSSLAAALWDVSHTKSANTNYFKKASVAFNLFPERIVEQLEKPPVRDLVLVGSHYSADYGNKRWQGEKVNCQVVKNNDPQSYNYGKKIVLVEGKPLAVFSNESASLAEGAKFTATLRSPPGASIVATTPKGNTIDIGQLKNFAYANRDWQGESAKILSCPMSIVLPLGVDGQILGVIARESANKLEKLSLISYKVNLPVNLVRSPATTTKIKVDLDSLSYPWQSAEVSNSSVVAPIVRDFLKLKSTEHFEGQKYTATWQKDEQLLVMKDKQGVTKLEARYDKGKWQEQINNLSQSEVKFFQEMKPKLQEQLARSQQSIERQRQVFRQEYQRLKNQAVQANLNFLQSGDEKIDTAVAMLVIKEAVDSNSNLKRVAQVLSMSDRVLEMKQTMPEVEYRALAEQYIFQTYQKADSIRENLFSPKQRQNFTWER